MSDGGGNDAGGNDGDGVADSLATVVSGGVLVSASKFVALGFGFLTQVAMARLLTEAAYGDVVLALTVVNVATLVAKLGMDDGVMREIPHHEDTPAKARGVVRASVGVGTVSGLLAGAAVFALAPTIATRAFHDPSLAVLLRIAAVGVPFSVLGSIAVSLARGARDARAHAYVNQLLRPAARFGLIAALVVAGAGAAGAVAGQTAAIALAGVAALWFARRTLPDFDVAPTPMYRSVLAFSLPLALFQSMGFLVANVDIYMLGYFGSKAGIGAYNIAFQLANLFSAVLVTVGFLLPPVLTRLQEQGERAEMRRTYQAMTKWMVVAGVPLFVVLFAFPESVIGLAFGDSYRDGATALRILVVGNFLAVLFGLNARSLVGLGANRVVNYVLVAQTGVNVALNYLLVPTYGIAGAAMASTVAVFVSDVLGSGFLYSRFGLHPFTRAVFRPATWTLAVGFGAAAATASTGLSVPVGAVAAAVTYPIAVFGALERQDALLVAELEDRTGLDLGPVVRLVRAADDDVSTVIQRLK
ncbi:flippase [Halorussus caseinilyticus]|uniref:Flippase n=1 Tax=Halorussus caseinilyticus TaxID=3034025 RepID=A0ABD5WLJ9_9EURY|nr:flippase [Halorussus sp. DT72]